MDKALSTISEDEIQELHKKIGSHVKKLREEKKISQLDMSLSIDIKSVAFYANCENSRQDKHFNIEHIYKICKILDVSLGSFFTQLENNLKK